MPNYNTVTVRDTAGIFYSQNGFVPEDNNFENIQIKCGTKGPIHRMQGFKGLHTVTLPDPETISAPFPYPNTPNLRVATGTLGELDPIWAIGTEQLRTSVMRNLAPVSDYEKLGPGIDPEIPNGGYRLKRNWVLRKVFDFSDMFTDTVDLFHRTEVTPSEREIPQFTANPVYLGDEVSETCIPEYINPEYKILRYVANYKKFRRFVIYERYASSGSMDFRTIWEDTDQTEYTDPFHSNSLIQLPKDPNHMQRILRVLLKTKP